MSEALNAILMKAASGDASAQYQAGNVFHRGLLETPRDPVRAKEWYEKAAVQGEVTGQYEAAQGLRKGRGPWPRRGSGLRRRLRFLRRVAISEIPYYRITVIRYFSLTELRLPAMVLRYPRGD